MKKKQKVLLTLLLIFVLIMSVYLGYFASQKYHEKKLSTEIVEKMYNNDTNVVEKIKETDFNVEKSVNDEKQSEEKNQEQENIIEEKTSSFSASSNKTQKSSKTESKTNFSVKTETKQKNNEGSSSNKASDKTGDNDKVAENNVVIEEKEDIPIETPKEEEKTEETSKTIEIVIEEPKKSDYENDPVYLKMKKELFPSREECTSKGIELSFKDKVHIASTMCSSESYKGKEVGFRLFIRYKDGTYEEYKR